jgi:hypothetical protein
MQEVQVTVIAAGFPKEETVEEPEPVQIIEWAARREQQQLDQQERAAEEALVAAAALREAAREEATPALDEEIEVAEPVFAEVTPLRDDQPEEQLEELDLFATAEVDLEKAAEEEAAARTARDLNIPTFMRKRMGLG